jgi:hypothetical protein
MMKKGLKKNLHQFNRIPASIHHDHNNAMSGFNDNRSTNARQRQLIQDINDSPAMTVQRQQLECSFGNPMQMVAEEEEELLQGKFETAQQQSLEEEEEPLQGKFYWGASPTRDVALEKEADVMGNKAVQTKVGVSGGEVNGSAPFFYSVEPQAVLSNNGKKIDIAAKEKDLYQVSMIEGGIIQKWPLYEENQKPRGGWKCHDAVFYWVLRELNHNAEKANKIINNIYGSGEFMSSFQWIGDALGYAEGVQLTEDTMNTVKAGDILFTGSAKLPTHSMVCDTDTTIQGFNNGGTFGGDTDKYEQRVPLNALRGVERNIWNDDKFGLYGAPLYKVTYDTASKKAKTYIKNYNG